MSRDMASQLDRTQQRYLPRLREASLALSDQLVRLRQGDDAALESMRLTTHRLAGAAGSFGFPEVSAVALAADAEVKARLADQGCSARAIELSDALLDVLRRVDGG